MNYIFDQINQNSYEIDQGNVTMSLTNWQNDANTHASTHALTQIRAHTHTLCSLFVSLVWHKSSLFVSLLWSATSEVCVLSWNLLWLTVAFLRLWSLLLRDWDWDSVCGENLWVEEFLRCWEKPKEWKIAGSLCRGGAPTAVEGGGHLGPPGPLSSASLLSGSGITSLGGGSWRPGGGRGHQEVVAAQSPAGNRRLPPASATAPPRGSSWSSARMSSSDSSEEEQGGDSEVRKWRQIPSRSPPSPWTPPWPESAGRQVAGSPQSGESRWWRTWCRTCASRRGPRYPTTRWQSSQDGLALV